MEAQLTHADSVSKCSIKSHDSVRVVGAHPLGSLRVCNDPVSSLAPSDLAGDAVVLLDIPPGFTIGYDAVSLVTRGDFRGIRDLPPGPHLVWVSTSGTAGVRYGFWVWADKVLPAHGGTIHVKQWDSYNELLGDPASNAEATFQRDSATGSQDLMPYREGLDVFASNSDRARGEMTPPRVGVQRPLSTPMPEFIDELSPAASWAELASSITPALLTRVIGKTAGVWPVTTLDTVRGEFELSQERKLYSSITAASLNFLFTQDTKTFSQDVTGRERTEQALDTTAHILSALMPPTSKNVGLLRRSPHGDARAHTDGDIIGEFQLAFIMGLLLGNGSCSDQWWYFLSSLLFCAYKLPVVRPGLARSLFRVLLAQLAYIHRYVEEGNIWDTPPNPRFSQASLQNTLATFRRRLHEELADLEAAPDIAGGGPSPQQRDAKVAFDQLESWLEMRGWDLSGQYVREGMVILDDGEEVTLRLKDDDADAEEDQGEFAPVVVEMDEDGKERGMVRWD